MAVIPNSNVNLATNIRDVLNAAGGNVTNEVITFFKPEANINKWSKHKPVYYPNSSPLTEQEFKLANYGFNPNNIARTTTPKAVMDEAIAGTDWYPYVLPTGGSNSPYRLSDFCGYTTNAAAPYSAIAYDGAVQSFPANINYEFIINSDSQIKISDLASFENIAGVLHYGILWTNDNSTYYLFRSAKFDEDNGTESVSVTLTVPKAGTYHFLAVYTNVASEYGNTDVSNTAEYFVPLPGTYKKVTVSQKTVYGVIAVSNIGSPYYISGSQTISGFNSYVKFNLTFPNGSTPYCAYKFGLYFEIETDADTYHIEWYHDMEYIEHSGGSTAKTVQFVDFPTYLKMEDILGYRWDPTYPPTVYSITARYIVERVDGQGFMYIPDDGPISISVS